MGMLQFLQTFLSQVARARPWSCFVSHLSLSLRKPPSIMIESQSHQSARLHLSLYGKKPLPEFRLWIVGKNGMLIFCKVSDSTESARIYVCRQYRAMSVHQNCANRQIGFIQRLTPWYFCRFAPIAAHMFIIMF